MDRERYGPRRWAPIRARRPDLKRLELTAGIACSRPEVVQSEVSRGSEHYRLRIQAAADEIYLTSDVPRGATRSARA